MEERKNFNTAKFLRTNPVFPYAINNDFKIINKVYNDFSPGNAPAGSAPKVMPFPGGILISIECIASL